VPLSPVGILNTPIKIESKKTREKYYKEQETGSKAYCID